MDPLVASLIGRARPPSRHELAGRGLSGGLRAGRDGQPGIVMYDAADYLGHRRHRPAVSICIVIRYKLTSRGEIKAAIPEMVTA